MAKIATCCYCGSRAALVLDRGRHELICASCGAPLRDIQAMPGHMRAASAASMAGGLPERPRRPVKPAKGGKVKKGRKNKHKSKGFGRVLKKVFDEIEDIFD